MALTVRSLWFLKPGALAHTSPAPISSYQPWTLARDGTQGLEKRLLTARMPRKEVPQRRGKVAPQGTVPRLRNPCLLLPKISAEPWIGLGPHKRPQHSSFHADEASYIEKTKEGTVVGKVGQGCGGGEDWRRSVPLFFFPPYSFLWKCTHTHTHPGVLFSGSLIF